MPVKRGRKQKKNLNGKGFFDVIKKVGNFIKDNKILSTVGSLIPHPGVQAAARLAGSVGLGRKKKRKTQKGGAMNLTGVRSTARPALKL